MSAWQLSSLSVLSLLVVPLALLIDGDLAIFVAGAAAAVSVGGLLVSHFLLRQMDAVVRAANAMAEGDFSARAGEGSGGTLGVPAEAFNRMAMSVELQMARASEERSRLEAALNSSIDAVAALDRDGRILFANLGFEKTFGTPSEEAIGEPMVWVLADEQVLDAIRDSREKGLGQIRVVERPGRRFLQVVTTPISGGGEWSVLLVCHDLTDVKRTELVRRDFVANVSHELRTPLAAIKAVVETLEEGSLVESETAHDFLRRADQEVDRLVLLVEELLELSRIESGEQPLMREDTDIAALITEVVQRLQSQAQRAEVDLRLESVDAARPYLDPARIERAVINLVQNAIKFTPAGGSVYVSAHQDEKILEIAVRDTGIGIASDEADRVFERFYKVDQSRSSVGTGLGLALVKHAVEAHGGSVRVQSALGEGSTFTITLPLDSAS